MARNTGEKVDVTVFDAPEFFANNPQVIRTDQELVLVFAAQPLIPIPFTSPKWAC